MSADFKVKTDAFSGEPPSSPGEKIGKLIEQRNCEAKDFAAELNISASLLSMILQGKRRLSSSVMDELERVTSIPALEWQEAQRKYEEWSESNPSQADRTSGSKKLSGVISRPDLLRIIAQDSSIVDPFVAANVAPASIDLCLGDSKKFRAWPLNKTRTRDGELGEKKARDHIVIQPGDTWRIWTLEQISMPASLCGRVSARSELLIEGISPGFGLHIDPLWKGHPFVLLTHNGDEPFELDHGQPCVSLELRVLSSPCSPG